MKETWRFKAVRQNLSGFFVRRADGTDQLIGTDEEALAFSLRIQTHFWQKCLRRVEARSFGAIDFSIPNTHRPRELAVIRPHETAETGEPTRRGCITPPGTRL